MKIIFKLSLILFIILSILISPIYAIEIKNRDEYLIDTRGDDGDIILTRICVYKKSAAHDIETSLFGEGQWNTDISEWEKILFGAEIGKYFWEHLYIGQSFQTISGQMLDYMAFDADSYSLDTTTKISVSVPFSGQYSLRIFEEYSLNLEKGKNEYCESGAEVTYSPDSKYSFGIGWRHTDRIHNFDTDYVSLFFDLDF